MEINPFGYQLLESKKETRSLTDFSFEYKLYPKEYNTFDSLGECLLIIGKKDEKG